MCGIAGIFGENNLSQIEVYISEMTNSLEHRGPDDSGDWSSALCALSHRRLSIIDLSRSGRQPLSNEDATLQLTCNGEIYNFRELRAELQQLGHHFVSDTDSEVIVHLYEEVEGDPDALLSRLDGMFAFGLWDGKRRRLLLARDRLGVKPLVYSRKAGFLLFASEAKAIFQSGLFKAKPLASAIFSYLLLRHSPAPATMYEEVDSLPSGHYLLAEVNKGVEIHKYWDIPVALSKSERIRPEKIHKLVSDAIRKRLVSDVPVGAYLSGGLDSSIVAAVMAKEMGGNLKTYAVGFGDLALDELPYARLVAQHIGSDHSEIILERDDYFDLLPDLIAKRGAPLAVPNEPPLYALSQALKEDITVVLSGEGADELFGGYSDYHGMGFDYAKAKNLRSYPCFLRHIFNGGMDKKYGTQFWDLSPKDFFLAGYHWFSPEDCQKLLNPVVFQQGSSFVSEMLDTFFDESSASAFFSHLFSFYQKVHLQNLLNRVDSMTMATAVEGRVPFTDHKLVEEIFPLPLEDKIRWRTFAHQAQAKFSHADLYRERNIETKVSLRRAFEGEIPEEILKRRKIGFKLPLEKWLVPPFSNRIQEQILDGEAVASGYLQKEILHSWLKESSWLSDDAQRLWMLYNLELWLKQIKNI